MFYKLYLSKEKPGIEFESVLEEYKAIQSKIEYVGKV